VKSSITSGYKVNCIAQDQVIYLSQCKYIEIILKHFDVVENKSMWTISLPIASFQKIRIIKAMKLGNNRGHHVSKRCWQCHERNSMYKLGLNPKNPKP
jgi:hypothetical protein